MFQVFECLGYVADADYGQVFERSGGGFGYCVGQAGGAAFRDEDCIGTSGVGGANDCAQVVRILYAVEDHKHFGTVDYVILIRVLRGCAEGYDALMGFVATGALKSIARFKADGDSVLTAEVNNFLEAGASCAFGDEYAVEGALGFQRFADRVYADENGHLMMVAACAVGGKAEGSWNSFPLGSKR